MPRLNAHVLLRERYRLLCDSAGTTTHSGTSHGKGVQHGESTFASVPPYISELAVLWRRFLYEVRVQHLNAATHRYCKRKL